MNLEKGTYKKRKGDSYTNFQKQRNFKSLTALEAKARFGRFKPRFYQIPIIKALDSGYRRIVAILPRRAGKDVTALNIMIREMWETPGVYYYLLPSYSQAKKICWEGQTSDGQKFLDFFPAELVTRSNSQDLTITMLNKHGGESLFQLAGTDFFDRLVGTNPRGIVFSEYALQDPRAYQYLNPILVANQGWAIFISTPRGRNHFYELAQIAKSSKDWFFYHLTVEETKHITLDAIEKERAEGILSEELIQQEFFTSFSRGIEGHYYGVYLQKARDQKRIGNVPWEESLPVSTVWDLGYTDSTAIIFFQTTGQGGIVRIIDCYSNNKKGLEHYVQYIQSKPYNYHKHIAPHDIKVKEWGTSMTRLEKASSLGLNFLVAKKLSVCDGIEAARTLFPKVWIDEIKCDPLLKALEAYRQIFDHKNKVYLPKPHHDWSSDFADAFRYLAISINMAHKDYASRERLERLYQEARYGEPSNIPEPFRTGSLW